MAEFFLLQVFRPDEQVIMWEAKFRGFEHAKIFDRATFPPILFRQFGKLPSRPVEYLPRRFVRTAARCQRQEPVWPSGLDFGLELGSFARTAVFTGPAFACDPKQVEKSRIHVMKCDGVLRGAERFLFSAILYVFNK
jgi:hypothetical protein